MFILLVLLLPLAKADVGTVQCYNNVNDVSAPSITTSTEYFNVTDGRGTYYILNRAYFNTTQVFNGYYPRMGSVFRKYNLKATNLISSNWFKDPFVRDFNDGIFVVIKNTKYNFNGYIQPLFSGLIFGSNFQNSTPTIVVKPDVTVQNGIVSGVLNVSVCYYHVCQYPFVGCTQWGGTNGFESITQAGDNPTCSYINTFSFNVNASWFLFHFYQDSGYFYAYFTDSGSVTRILFDTYIGVDINYYFIMPVMCNVEISSNPLQTWVTELYNLDFMLSFNETGDIIGAVDCTADPLSAIKCQALSHKPPTGVYNIPSVLPQPNITVTLRQSDVPDCNITDWLMSNNVSTPLNWERKTFTNCNFNLSAAFSRIAVTNYQCSSTSLSNIAGKCFKSITLDKFLYPAGIESYLQYNYVPDNTRPYCFASYGLSQDLNVVRGNPSSWNNLYMNYSSWMSYYDRICTFGNFQMGVVYKTDYGHVPAVDYEQSPCNLNTWVSCSESGSFIGFEAPTDGTKWRWCYYTKSSSLQANFHDAGSFPVSQVGQSLSDSKIPCYNDNGRCDCSRGNDGTPFTTANWFGYQCGDCVTAETGQGKCRIAAYAYFDGSGGTTCSVDQLTSQTSVVEDVCVNYDLYGVKGTGIIHRVNDTVYKDFQTLTYDFSGTLIGFRDVNTGLSYSISPCYFGSISAAYSDQASDAALLYRDLDCDYVLKHNITYSNVSDNHFDSDLGCVVNAFNSTSIAISDCNMTVGNSYCVNYIKPITTSRRRRALDSSGYNLNSFQPYIFQFANDSVKPIGGLYTVNVPTNFTIGAVEEFLQTSAPKVTIDCAAYVCGDYAACRTQLAQYGSFCDNINSVLSDVNNIIDNAVLSVVDNVVKGVFLPSDLDLGLDDSDFNVKDLYGCLGPNCLSSTGVSGRSAIEDFFFNKVTIADVGFTQAWANCTGGVNARDLICSQTYNGIKVLPPIMTDDMIGGYVGGAAISVGYIVNVNPGQTVLNTRFAFAINGLGVTMQVIQDNMKTIANAFNNALDAMQQGFQTTSDALAQMQAVVNNNAAALNALVVQLSNKFGAISNSLQDILTRLDAVESAAQIDRLINGRLTALNTYVSQQLSKITMVKQSASLAIEKINECVKSQSTRVNFCGSGGHIMSFMQNAPYGIVFIHFGYVPTNYTSILSAPGLCVANGRNIVAKNGYLAYNEVDDQWFYTGSAYYYPEPITENNVIFVDTCSVNFTKVPEIVLGNDNDSFPSLPDFKDELEQWFENKTSHAPDLSLNFTELNATFVDINEQLKQLQDTVKALNESYINLKELGIYTMYVKWPWYVWLLIGLACLAALVLLFFICCCTGCGTLCAGKCGSCCEDYGGHEHDIVIKTSHED